MTEQTQNGIASVLYCNAFCLKKCFSALLLPLVPAQRNRAPVSPAA